MKSQKVAQYARTVKELGLEVQELLRQESDDKDEREMTLKMLNVALADESTMEKVTKRVDETNASLLRLTKQSKYAIARENKLIAAIEKKKNDVERSYKLLASLNTTGCVESTHSAEYDRLQNELEVEYERYVVKIRNIDYLESELRSHHSLLLQQRERAERKIRRMRDAYHEETLGMLECEGDEVESAKRDDYSAANASLSDDDDTEHSRSDGDESISAPSCGEEEYDSDGSDF